jgi:hypothetical protein
MSQYSQLAPYVKSDILTPEKAMGLSSYFSAVNPEEASTMTEQFVRATMANRLRERGMKAPEGIDTVKSGDYMKSIGADKSIDPVEIGKMIASDLKQQQAKGGKDFSAYDYLRTHGFNNDADVKTVLSFAGGVNSGDYAAIEKAQDAPLQIGAPGKGQIDQMFDERVSQNKFLKGRQVELSEQLATTRQGLKEEPLILAQRAAFARLKNQGKIGGSFEDWQGTGAMRAGTQDLFFGNYHGQVNREAMHSLEAERKRLGIQAPGVMESGGSHEYMLRYARSVDRAGGDVTRGVSDDLQSAARALQDAAKDIRDAQRGDRQVPGAPGRTPPMIVIPPPLTNPSSPMMRGGG